jgi:hypothetical protein
VKKVEHSAAETGRLLGDERPIRHRRDPRDVVRIARDIVVDSDALDTLYGKTDTIRHPEELDDPPDGRDPSEIVRAGVLLVRVVLAGKDHEPVAAHDVVDEAEALRLPDRQGQDPDRIRDEPAEGQHG